jgi:uncharacterized protein YjaG (DUF416 family)
MAIALTSMYKFDERAIVTRLSHMNTPCKVMFALCCATRQLNAWETFSRRFEPEKVNTFREVLEQIWHSFDTNVVRIGWTTVLNEVMELLPEEQNEWAPLHVYADHAVSSLAYALRCLVDSNEKEAAWAARRAYEAADQGTIRQLAIQGGPTDSESHILSFPIVQRELSRQENDLAAIERLGAPEALDQLKPKALSEHVLTAEELLA